MICLMAMPSVVSAISGIYIVWIKHEMKERLEENNLQTVTLKNQDVVWYEKGREIIIQGELFDVKTYIEHQEYTSFVGLFDKAESSYASIADKTMSKSAENKQLEDIGAYFHQLLLIHTNTTNTNHAGFSAIRYDEYLQSTLANYFQTIPSPPPDLCFS